MKRIHLGLKVSDHDVNEALRKVHKMTRKSKAERARLRKLLADGPRVLEPRRSA